RVRQARDRPRLGEEALARRGPDVERAEELDGHGPVEERVVGQVDAAHRALAERSLDPVLLELAGRVPAGGLHGSRLQRADLARTAGLAAGDRTGRLPGPAALQAAAGRALLVRRAHPAALRVAGAAGPAGLVEAAAALARRAADLVSAQVGAGDAAAWVQVVAARRLAV